MAALCNHAGPVSRKPVFDERRPELEPGCDRTRPQRLRQMVLKLDRVLHVGNVALDVCLVFSDADFSPGGALECSHG